MANSTVLPNTSAEYNATLLGIGGFSHVYRVTGSQTDVAVKVINKMDEKDYNFRHEVNGHLAFQRFDLAPRYLGTFQEGQSVALVMEYLPGETLKQVNKNGAPLELRLRGVQHLIEKLSTAWDFGLEHSDLKPANVVIST